MKIGYKTSLRGGRCISKMPTYHLMTPLMTRVDNSKKQELQKIVDNKPIVDKLIEKVGKLKVKPSQQETQKVMIKQQQEYVKKLHKKPKKRISLDF